MKILTKLSFILTSLAALTSSTALADDSISRQQVDQQRQQAEHNKTTAVAAYVKPHSVLGSGMQDPRSEKRSSAPGQTFVLPTEEPRGFSGPR